MIAILIWKECVKGEKQSTYLDSYHFCCSSFICKFYPLDNSWVGKIPWRRKCQSIPVFLSGRFHGQRSLEGYSPWGHKELDTTECVCVCVCVCIKSLGFDSLIMMCLGFFLFSLSCDGSQNFFNLYIYVFIKFKCSPIISYILCVCVCVVPIYFFSLLGL